MTDAKTNAQKRAAKVAEEFKQIREAYASDPRSETVNMMIYGDWGSGKTTLAATSRQPILFHSFDPGGLTSIQGKIQSGAVIPDSSWEKRFRGTIADLASGVTPDGTMTNADPNAFQDWGAEVNRLYDEGVFDYVGTFVIDSYTTFSRHLMAWIKKKRGTLGQDNDWGDWRANLNKTQDVVQQLMQLPCNVILTAHKDTDRDEVSGEMIGGPMAAGQLTAKLPLMFDEVYYLDVEGEGEAATYRLHTKNHRIYPARSRLASQHDLDAIIENPNLKEILKKSGYPWKRVEMPEQTEEVAV